MPHRHVPVLPTLAIAFSYPDLASAMDLRPDPLSPCIRKLGWEIRVQAGTDEGSRHTAIQTPAGQHRTFRNLAVVAMSPRCGTVLFRQTFADDDARFLALTVAQDGLPQLPTAPVAIGTRYGKYFAWSDDGRIIAFIEPIFIDESDEIAVRLSLHTIADIAKSALASEARGADRVNEGKRPLLDPMQPNRPSRLTDLHPSKSESPDGMDVTVVSRSRSGSQTLVRRAPRAHPGATASNPVYHIATATTGNQIQGQIPDPLARPVSRSLQFLGWSHDARYSTFCALVKRYTVLPGSTCKTEPLFRLSLPPIHRSPMSRISQRDRWSGFRHESRISNSGTLRHRAPTTPRIHPMDRPSSFPEWRRAMPVNTDIAPLRANSPERRS